MNRRYTEFSQLKISGEPKPPTHPAGIRVSMPAESTAAWPGAPGPKGPGINKLKWSEPKVSAKQDMPDDRKSRVSKKISKLMHEGKEQDEAVATAMSMERKHRLTEGGGYIRKKKRY